MLRFEEFEPRFLLAGTALHLLPLRPSAGAASARVSAHPHEPASADHHRTLIIGHKGNSGIAPENTLVAIAEAFNVGADVVEVDVHLTADGVPVLMHDSTVDRTTNGTGILSQMTLEQIKALDAGSWKGPAYAGERVPTLAEAIQQVSGRGILYLDWKFPRFGAIVKRVLDDLGVPDNAIWASANTPELLADIHDNLPGTPILWWGLLPPVWNASYFQGMRDNGIVGFDMEWGTFSPQFMRDAQANGMFFSTYIVNNASTLRYAVDLGLDAIETDLPGTLAALVAGPIDNITAKLAGGQLIIRGDRYNNELRIEPGATPNSLRITGLNGTAINGQMETVGFTNVHNVRIFLAEGDDVVRISDIVLDGGMSVDTGSGDDQVVISNSQIHSAVKVKTFSGLDRVRVDASIFDVLMVDGGQGIDLLDSGILSQPNSNGNQFNLLPVLRSVERYIS